MTLTPCTRASFFFFFNDTATTEIYTLSLHDALPISVRDGAPRTIAPKRGERVESGTSWTASAEAYALMSSRRSVVVLRSEEHTSELQSRPHLVCRLLLEKKKHPTSEVQVALARRRRI